MGRDRCSLLVLTRPGSILELTLAPIAELTLAANLTHAVSCARVQRFDAIIVEHRSVPSLLEANERLAQIRQPVLCIVEREQLSLVAPPARPLVRGPDLSNRIVDELRASRAAS
jgi:hypothetical protein